MYQYLKERNPVAAARVVERIRTAAQRVGELPRMGHIGLVPGAYEWVVTGLPYVIVYQIDTDRDEVVILAVFHRRQDRQSEK
ncbi:MAG: type II toxin-antitoxin system RelE/ParE family toxin [Xanthobacteraceae bacterium]